MSKSDYLVRLLQEATNMNILPDSRLLEELIEDLEYKLDLYESHKNNYQ